MTRSQFFASDNCATVHPDVMSAITRANRSGHAISYGDDGYTHEALATLKELFGPSSSSWFVYNGTAANVVAIRSLLKAWQSVLAPPSAHLNEDECGSLEAMAGIKIEQLPHEGGKIAPASIVPMLGHLGFVHRVQPGMVSVTQSTELGRVYRIGELQEIGRICREHELVFHMDGARIANAVAFILCEQEPGWEDLSSDALLRRGREILAAMTLDAGVHALSLGGTKNGLMFGEAVVLMNGAENNRDLPFFRKQNAQLASKMRYISAQFSAMFDGNLWLHNALHANAMARQLASGIEQLASRHRDALTGSRGSVLRVQGPVEANAVFVVMPAEWAQHLQERFMFYDWDDESYRLMCSWDTTLGEVKEFLSMLGELVKGRV